MDPHLWLAVGNTVNAVAQAEMDWLATFLPCRALINTRTGRRYSVLGFQKYACKYMKTSSFSEEEVALPYDLAVQLQIFNYLGEIPLFSQMYFW